MNEKINQETKETSKLSERLRTQRPYYFAMLQEGKLQEIQMQRRLNAEFHGER